MSASLLCSYGSLRLWKGGPLEDPVQTQKETLILGSKCLLVKRVSSHVFCSRVFLERRD